MRIAELIEKATADCLAGISQPHDAILQLLAADPAGEEAALMRAKADWLSHEVTGGRGYLWGAIGLDFKPCECDCSFCSFGSKWGIIAEERVLTDEEVIAHAGVFARGGVDFITLRSTEFYDLDTIARQVRLVRENVPGDYRIVINVGELDEARARAMYDAGVFAAYHVVRLREGLDTPFDPAVRLNTVHAIAASPLALASCVEPIGPEHTDEELARAIEVIAQNKALISGVMARIPVPGTPFGDVPVLEPGRLSQILAVLRLSVSCDTKVMAYCPPTDIGFASGANMASFELGANPRDTDFNEENWRCFTIDRAKRVLEENDYYHE